MHVFPSTEKAEAEGLQIQKPVSKVKINKCP
jgi:hypothetical protein